MKNSHNTPRNVKQHVPRRTCCEYPREPESEAEQPNEASGFSSTAVCCTLSAPIREKEPPTHTGDEEGDGERELRFLPLRKLSSSLLDKQTGFVVASVTSWSNEERGGGCGRSSVGPLSEGNKAKFSDY